MIHKIKKEIRKSLKNNFLEYDYQSIKTKIEDILSNHNSELSDYKVICDATNNYLDTDKYLKIDIYIKTFLSQTIINNITITKL